MKFMFSSEIFLFVFRDGLSVKIVELTQRQEKNTKELEDGEKKLSADINEIIDKVNNKFGELMTRYAGFEM